MKINAVLMVTLLMLVLTSCDPFSNDNPSISNDYSSGIWIMNEGNFGQSNGGVTIQQSGTRYADPFYTVNGTHMGDVLQRVIRQDGKYYAVCNGSNKIVVGNTTDLKVIFEITGLDYPRDIVVNNGFIYVAEGATTGKVGKYNASTGAWIGDIAVGNGPERLMVANNQLWVANSGGWVTDNSVTVIDLSTYTVLGNVTVGDRPSDLAFDPISGEMEVLGMGETLYDSNWNVTGHTAATLTSVRADLSIAGQTVVGQVGDHPRFMDVLDGQILVVNGGVDAYSNTLTLLCDNCIDGNLYSIDAVSDGRVFVTKQPDFTSNSVVYEYNWNNLQLNRTMEGGIGSHSVSVQ
jgi:YVTN family beta-propeller protein